MYIDSGGVLVEVSVDLESGFNGSIGHDFGLDGGNIGSNRVGRLSEVKVLGVWLSGIVRVAGLGASGGSSFLRGAIQSARGDKVRLAPLVISVSVTGNNSS